IIGAGAGRAGPPGQTCDMRRDFLPQVRIKKTRGGLNLKKKNNQQKKYFSYKQNHPHHQAAHLSFCVVVVD
ncbi:hypothetical protein, partial [Enterobacter intestinihominis]